MVALELLEAAQQRVVLLLRVRVRVRVRVRGRVRGRVRVRVRLSRGGSHRRRAGRSRTAH